MSIESFANQHVLELVAYQPGKPIEETARELGLNPHDTPTDSTQARRAVSISTPESPT